MSPHAHQLFDMLEMILGQSAGKRLGEEFSKLIVVPWKCAIVHLAVYILSYQLHIPADIPKFLTDVEVLFPSFLSIQIQF